MTVPAVPHLYADNIGLLHESEVYTEISRIGTTTGMSLAPILAYEPTFGTIYGAAIFLERPFAPQYDFASRLAFSTEGEYSALFSLKRFTGPDNFFHLEVEVDDFARPYYGEGMETDPDKRVFLEGTFSRAIYFLRFLESGKVSYGPFLDFRGATREGVEGADVPEPDYEEATLGVGMNFYYDSRDSRLSPSTGVFDSLILRVVPQSFSSARDRETFYQAEVDHRLFYSPRPGTVLAGRLNLVKSWGDPSYQYRYFLGGPYQLRGYYTNRFRGDSLYNLQAELRQQLFWIFSGAVFAELGEVTDGGFDSPETSYGAGLRLTLPPDHVAKARLDFAWARDQRSIYFIFGEAF